MVSDAAVPRRRDDLESKHCEFMTCLLPALAQLAARIGCVPCGDRTTGRCRGL
ncbi:MAG TPA: hypothetical protein VIX73_01945 [Kofleriaceae bacterium]|jgi:hypothetical protein